MQTNKILLPTGGATYLLSTRYFSGLTSVQISGGLSRPLSWKDFAGNVISLFSFYWFLIFTWASNLWEPLVWYLCTSSNKMGIVLRGKFKSTQFRLKKKINLLFCSWSAGTSDSLSFFDTKSESVNFYYWPLNVIEEKVFYYVSWA